VRPSLPLGATTEYDRSGQSSDSWATPARGSRRSEVTSAEVARLRIRWSVHTPEGVWAVRSGPSGASPTRPRARIAGGTPSAEAGSTEADSVSTRSRPSGIAGGRGLAKLPTRQDRGGSAHATARSSFTPSLAEASERMHPRRGGLGRSRDLGGKEALGRCPRPRPRAPARALSGGDAHPSAEAEGACVLVPRVASHRYSTEVEDRRKTRSTGNPTAAPVGFGPFRRFQLREALLRVTSPEPSALGVSHPLSGLILPEPRGFVSRHIRP
jgi:hypothetical protein